MNASSDGQSDVGLDAVNASEELDATDAPSTSDALLGTDCGSATADEIQSIFTHSCAVATTAFHAAANTNSLRLDTRFSFAQLINVPSIEVPGMMRVLPGDPTNSFLYVKLQRATLNALPDCPGSSVCGRTPMPAPPVSPLYACQIDQIRRWIEMGAPTM